MKQVSLNNQSKIKSILAVYLLATASIYSMEDPKSTATIPDKTGVITTSHPTASKALLSIDELPVGKPTIMAFDFDADDEESTAAVVVPSKVIIQPKNYESFFLYLDELPSIDEASVHKACREFIAVFHPPLTKLRNLAKVYRNNRYEEIVDRATRYFLPSSHWYIDLCSFLDRHTKDPLDTHDDPGFLRHALQGIEDSGSVASMRLLPGKHPIFSKAKKSRGKDAAEVESYIQNTPYSAILPLKEDVALAMVGSHAEFPYVEAQDLADYMKARIIGQDTSVEGMASLIHAHYVALRHDPGVGGVTIKKPNMLLAGPTGSGKTEFFRVLERIMNTPVFIFNATSMSPTSWKGDNMDEVMEQLYMKAGQDKALAERSVVVLDEFDKILRTHNEDDPKGLHGAVMQRGMLKVVEGDTFVMKGGASINTHKMLFVFMGSFSGLKGLKKGLIEDAALKEYGMIDELRGRISGFFTFKKATEDTYHRILMNPRTSPLEAAKVHLRQVPYALRINFTDRAITEIASYAFLLETGARSLDRCVDKIKQHFIQNIRRLRPADGSEIMITAAMVQDILGKKPHILPVEEEEEDWGELYRRLGIIA